MAEITICAEVWDAIESSFSNGRGRRAYKPSPDTLAQAINDDLILHREKGATHPGGVVELTERRLNYLGLNYDPNLGIVIPHNGNGHKAG